MIFDKFLRDKIRGVFTESGKVKVDAEVTVPEVEVVKAFYTADDLDEDNKIIFTDEMKEFEIWNNNLDEGLEFTIGEITIPIESKNVDSKGLPNKYHFSGCFASFTEVEIAGDDLDFDVIVSG